MAHPSLQAASYAGRVTIVLRLLDRVSLAGEPITGGRPADLLAALTLHRPGLPDSRLVEAVWGAERPASPAKALHVLVSRLRALGGPGLVVRHDSGYRLGLDPEEVDALLLGRLARDGRAALRAGDPEAALAATGRAGELVSAVGEPSGSGPLAMLRREALCVATDVQRDHGLALSRCGKDAEAVPLLLTSHGRDADDSEVLEALLRSEAATVGVPLALARYDAYRRGLADRLGLDPDEGLQRVQRELLAADEPVRSGLRYDADELLGRDHDLVRLRALVRSGRLTSILGPGGLGKTRIAHVLAREATQPRVHFVELVGIASPEDVVSEVGSALGVRNSVTGRRRLTPAQLADVRGRVAQELDAVPTLLVLDNCEHVLDAVASLVAFLLATTRDLRVVTTSRAPLGIAAERVFQLSQLAPTDSAELFRLRARAARPDAELPADTVDAIVERLDGLPLAVELAAARMRTMSADEVRRALGDRFALLRGRDRTAPARHQTLAAVISWSWDLLAPAEQRALAWLSVFHDGVSGEAAVGVLGHDGHDLVDALVDQSLLSVIEDHGVSRYRMLETVREFAGQRLVEEGSVDEARAAQTGWAVGIADSVSRDVWGPRQVEAMDLLSVEESNLTDVLRRSLAAGDPASAVRLLASLGALWAVTGNHARFFALADLAEQVLLDWEPPPGLVGTTQDALGLLVVFTGFVRPDGVADLVSLMARLGVPQQPWTRVLHQVFVEVEHPQDRVRAAVALSDDPDPRAALMGLQWAAVLSENAGELAAARRYAEAALARVDAGTTLWQVATLHTQVAMLALQEGDHGVAAEHARIAVPMLVQLHAEEDALTMRTTLALAALRDGALAEAEQILAEAGEPAPTDVTGSMVKTQVRAELLLARGDLPGGLSAFDEALTGVRAVRFPGVDANGLEPWTALAASTALMAHVRFGGGADDLARTADLATQVHAILVGLLAGPEGALDYPVTGMTLAAMAGWLLRERPTAQAVEHGVRLLALARRYGYNRWFPVMAWEPLVQLAEDAAPGRLTAVLEQYGDRLGRELREETVEVASRLGVTSSG